MNMLINMRCVIFLKMSSLSFLWWFSRDNLKSLLETQVSLTQNYRTYPNAQNQQYFETKVVKVSEDEESCHVLLGFRYIDDIIKKKKQRRKGYRML
mgnify:CR=1 FL=1